MKPSVTREFQERYDSLKERNLSPCERDIWNFFYTVDFNTRPDNLRETIARPPGEGESEAKGIDKLKNVLAERVIARARSYRKHLKAVKKAKNGGKAPPKFDPPSLPSYAGPALSHASCEMRSAIKKYFDINIGRFDEAFSRFACGLLRDPAISYSAGEPDGGYFFLWAEFAYLCVENNVDADFWKNRMKTFVSCQDVFVSAYPPGPLRRERKLIAWKFRPSDRTAVSEERLKEIHDRYADLSFDDLEEEVCANAFHAWNSGECPP